MSPFDQREDLKHWTQANKSGWACVFSPVDEVLRRTSKRRPPTQFISFKRGSTWLWKSAYGFWSCAEEGGKNKYDNHRVYLTLEMALEAENKNADKKTDEPTNP